MDKIVDALKNLYAAMGGSAEDVANVTLIPDMINAIAELKKAEAAEAEDDGSEG